jgi:multicomponent Na+:H+ antiporter subunit B
LKIVGFLAAFSTGLLLLFAVADFPDWADPQAPASIHVSPHYITHTIEETAVPNVVTSVLADYRGYDTMLETTVVFAAGLAVYALLRRKSKKYPTETDEEPEEEIVLPHQALIVKTVARLLAPFMQIFALYVIAHGHHSPGGGFQGGVILGASFILLAISYDLKMILDRMKERTNLILLTTGVIIYSGIGTLCALFKMNFLDYSALTAILPATDKIMARSHGIFGVEIGVAFTVMSAMIIIYVNLSSNGKYDSGL